MNIRCRLGLHDWSQPAHRQDMFQVWWRINRICRRGCGARRSEHDNPDSHYEQHHDEWTDDTGAKE